MSTKYTPGPWHNQGNLIFSADHTHVAKLFTLPRQVGESEAREEGANAARIVACVNACEGINPEAVPEMLAALKLALKYLFKAEADGMQTAIPIGGAIRNLQGVIAKAKGE